MDDEAKGRERDLERFLTFVDAIVAIAITLLVLPLVDIAGGLHNGSVTHLLKENQAHIWAFLLSFAVIANLWLTQHRLLQHVVAANSTLLRLMLLWTLTIVVLPFPTALVASPGADQPVTQILYVGTMMISAVLLWLICVTVIRDPGIRDSDQVPHADIGLTTVVTFVIILVLMLAIPALSYWPLLLLILPDRMVRLWRHRQKRATGEMR